MTRDRNRQTLWSDRAFLGLHYDLHASPADTALGAELTHEHLRERLLRVKPDWVQCDAKGHPGYASYPSALGNAAPGIVRDALRIHRDVTRELGLPLVVHFSGTYDMWAIAQHPDWARVFEDGRRRDQKETCNRSPYTRALMIPQMLEIIDRYDVDGFWVDGENWASGACWCKRCCREFRRRTGLRKVPVKAGDPGWDEWLAFHREAFVEHVRQYADAVHARKPTCAVCSNWMYSVRQPDPVAAPVDYLSGDFDPLWGGNRAAVEGRLFDGRRRPWNLMLWMFAGGGGQPWNVKPLPHLLQEAAGVIALGGALQLYDQPQRTGWLTGWHQDWMAAVARFARARQAACFQSRSRSQAAILYLNTHHYSTLENTWCLFLAGRDQSSPPLEGALHALLETGRSADVLTVEALDRLDEYALLVLPEQTRVAPEVRRALERFVRNGGHLVLTGEHVARELGGLTGAVPQGAPPDATFLPVDETALAVGGTWQPVRPLRGTAAWVYRLKQQEPTKDRTDDVVVTWRRLGRGSVLAVHGPLFREYFLTHHPRLRQFIGGLVARLPMRWEVELDAPPWVELVVREKDGGMRINLINRGASEALSANRPFVESVPPVRGIVVRVRRAKPPRAVRQLPENRPLRWTHAGGVATIRLPRLEIHTVIEVR